MCPLYEGFPAIIYTGLWTLRTFRKLESTFQKFPIRVAFFLTDSPPAFLVKIEKSNFKIEILEDVKDAKDLEDVECDGYLALPTEVLYKGVNGIRGGIDQGTVRIKNFDTMTILAKITGVS